MLESLCHFNNLAITFWRSKVNRCSDSAASHVIKGQALDRASGDQRATLEIRTTLPGREMVKVPVSIEVISPVKVKPALVYMGRIQKGRSIQRQVQIDAVREGLSLALSLPESKAIAGIKTSLQPVNESGSSWLLTVVADGEAMEPGSFKHIVVVELSDYDKPIEVTLYGNVTE